MNKKIIIALVFIGVIIIISIIFTQHYFFVSNKNLGFSIGKCDSYIDPYSLPKEGILNQSWKNQDTLVVETYVKTYCGGATITGDYNVNRNNLILKYKIKLGDAVIKCFCTHKVTYEIPDLENKDYDISITQD